MARDRSWPPLVAAGIIVFLAVAAIVAYVLYSEGDRGSSTRVKSGAACDELSAAAAALRSRERDRMDAALVSAAKDAIASLQRSDLRFGLPEKVALKLESVVLEKRLPRDLRRHVMDRLEAAQRECSTLVS